MRNVRCGRSLSPSCSGLVRQRGSGYWSGRVCQVTRLQCFTSPVMVHQDPHLWKEASDGGSSITFEWNKRKDRFHLTEKKTLQPFWRNGDFQHWMWKPYRQTVGTPVNWRELKSKLHHRRFKTAFSNWRWSAFRQSQVWLHWKRLCYALVQFPTGLYVWIRWLTLPRE